jgi:hypothetical protein
VLDEGIPGWIQQGQPTEGAVSGHVPDHRRDYAAMAAVLGQAGFAAAPRPALGRAP